jgi:hypothetical protein
VGAQLRFVSVRRACPGGLVSSYEDMSAADLRMELDEWRQRALRYARELLDARDGGDFAWEQGIAIALRLSLAQVRRIERLLQLGVAA